MNSHPVHIVPTWQLILLVAVFLAVLLLTNCQTEPVDLVETAVPTVAIVPTPTPEASNTIEPQSKLAQALQNILDHAVIDGVPSAVLMVDAPDLNFTWKGAAGLADPATGQVIAVDDPFFISGGAEEMFTAVTLLKLSEQSQFNLEDSISLYLPADLVSRLLVLDDKSYGEQITVHQLLNHTSGLGDFADGNKLDALQTPDAILDWAIDHTPPVRAPGEAFHHSATNFLLAGSIIEKVSGLPLSEAYRQFIFEPLGMAHTHYVGYENVGGRMGSLISTAEDQTRFLRAWADGKLFNNPACQGIMSNWIQTGNTGEYYGLGMQRFVIDEWDMPGLGQVYGHVGQSNSLAFYWPEQNVTLVGTLNSNEPPSGIVSMMLDVMSAIQEYANKRFIVGNGRC